MARPGPPLESLLVQIKVTITNHDFGPDYKLHWPKLHGSAPSEYKLLKIFSPIFEQLALALKKQSCPKIFTVLNILFTFRIFNSLRLPLAEFPWNFSLYWIYFLPFKTFEQLCLPWKIEIPSSLYWIHFLHSGVLSNLRLPWKTELSWNI